MEHGAANLTLAGKMIHRHAKGWLPTNDLSNTGRNFQAQTTAAKAVEAPTGAPPFSESPGRRHVVAERVQPAPLRLANPHEEVQPPRGRTSLIDVEMLLENMILRLDLMPTKLIP